MDTKVSGQKFEEKQDIILILKIPQDNYQLQKGK